MRDIAKTTDGDYSKIGGFDKLCAQAQEHVRNDTKAGEVLEKEFKGFPEAFALGDAFMVEHARSNRAGCRAPNCIDKIGKGEIRLGTMERSHDDQGTRIALTSWQWFHW